MAPKSTPLSSCCRNSVIGFRGPRRADKHTRKPQSRPMSSAGDLHRAEADAKVRSTSSLLGGLCSDNDPASQHLKGIIAAQALGMNVTHTTKAQDLVEGTL